MTVDYQSVKENERASDDANNLNVIDHSAEKPLSKVNTNIHLFNTYYKRSSIKDVEHLNLIETKRRNIDRDDEDW